MRGAAGFALGCLLTVLICLGGLWGPVADLREQRLRMMSDLSLMRQETSRLERKIVALRDTMRRERAELRKLRETGRILSPRDVELILRIAPQLRQRRNIGAAQAKRVATACVVASRVHRVPVRLLLAVAEVESAFDPNAVSVSGRHHGMFQTCRQAWMTGGDGRIPWERRYDPMAAALAGGGYLAKLVDSHHGNMRRALMFYNAGGTGGGGGYARKVMSLAGL